MAAHHSFYGQADIKVALAPQVATDNTALVGQWIDMQNATACTFVFLTGDLADADAVFAVTLEHADLADKSDAAAVSAADLIGTLAGAGFTFANDTAVKEVGYRAHKRYVRPTVTPTGNAGNAPISALAILYPTKFTGAV